jgi:hypothetical protein
MTDATKGSEGLATASGPVEVRFANGSIVMRAFQASLVTKEEDKK